MCFSNLSPAQDLGILTLDQPTPLPPSALPKMHLDLVLSPSCSQHPVRPRLPGSVTRPASLSTPVSCHTVPCTPSTFFFFLTSRPLDELGPPPGVPPPRAPRLPTSSGPISAQMWPPGNPADPPAAPRVLPALLGAGCPQNATSLSASAVWTWLCKRSARTAGGTQKPGDARSS